MKIKKLQTFWSKILFLAIGFGSLAWFLIRVIPKPSRAFYPCQRAAFPMASSFIIWIIATISGIFSLSKAKSYFINSQKGFAFLLFIIGAFSFITSWVFVPKQKLTAKETNTLTLPALKNFITNDKTWIASQEAVAIIKSDKENSNDITIDEIDAMVRNAIQKAGGFEELVSEANTIVVKPNLVGRLEYSGGGMRQFPEFNNGVVTNWRVIKAVVALIREYSPNSKVFVLEGSADGGKTSDMFSYFGYNHENIPGVTEFICLEDRSGAYEDWDSDSLQSVILPANKALYANSFKPNNTDEFYLNKLYFNADVVISVPMLKNHSMTSVTGAVKNVGIGATPATIYAGRNDIHRYFQNRINHQNTNGYENLHKFIHDFYLCRPVDYVIMDGLQGTDYGPVAEHPSNFASSQKNMGVIIAGKQAVSVDAIASLLMGYDPSKVKHLLYLHNDTVGTIDPRLINVESDPLQTLKKNFKHNESTQPKYFDFTTPIVEISNYEVNSSKLSFSLASDDEIIKVELEVNGAKIPEVCISGFEHVEYDLSNYDISTDTSIVIKVYDKYLNRKTFKGDGRIVASLKSKGTLKISIYPNPIHNNLNFQILDEYIGLLDANIYTSNGTLIKSQTYNKTQTSQEFYLNINDLATGIYLLELNSGKTKQLLRFLKN